MYIRSMCETMRRQCYKTWQRVSCVHVTVTSRQQAVLCPQIHIITTKTTTASGIRQLSSPQLVQSTRCPVRELSSLRAGNERVGVSASCAVTTLKLTPILTPLTLMVTGHFAYETFRLLDTSPTT